jgi:hypothetical protein
LLFEITLKYRFEDCTFSSSPSDKTEQFIDHEWSSAQVMCKWAQELQKCSCYCVDVALVIFDSAIWEVADHTNMPIPDFLDCWQYWQFSSNSIAFVCIWCWHFGWYLNLIRSSSSEGPVILFDAFCLGSCLDTGICSCTRRVCSARKVAILLAIGDREFTFGELSISIKAGCHLANKNYDFWTYNSPNAISKSTLWKPLLKHQYHHQL